VEWNGEHYADHTAHHRAFDHVLLERLEPLAPHGRILDIGCGVGNFTAGLVDRVPSGSVLGVDADASMVATAQANHRDQPQLAFQVTPAQDLGTLVPLGPFAAIVSTACLHWVPELDHPSVLQAAHDLLESGGQWCVEFGGRGQVDGLRKTLDPLAIEFGGGPPRWFFPDVATYSRLLSDADFVDVDVQLVTQNRSMEDAAALRGLLTSQVLFAYLSDIDHARHDEFIQAASDAVIKSVEAGPGPANYDVEYVRIVASARKRL
jgi:trans-aconitate methyltransferase